MKKKFISILSVISLILLFFNIQEEAGVNANTLVSIPDESFKACINEQLGENVSSEVTVAQMASLTDRLRCDNKNIVNIEGAQYLVNLNRLYLNENKIQNLEPLSNLPKLKYLTLNNQNIDLGDKIINSSIYSLEHKIVSINNNEVLYLGQNKYDFIHGETRNISNDWNEVFILNNSEHIFSGTITQKITYEKLDEKVEIEVLKQVEDASRDGHIGNGEDVYFKIKLINSSEMDLGAYTIRDELKDINGYFMNYENVEVKVNAINASNESPIHMNFYPNTVTYKDLMTDGLMIESLPADSIITVTYILVAKDDIEYTHAGELIHNIVYIDPVYPQDPDPLNPEVEIPVRPEIYLDVSVRDANENGYIENGEEILYEIVLMNASEVNLGTYSIISELKDINEYFINYEDVEVKVIVTRTFDGSPIHMNFHPNPITYKDLMTDGLMIESLPADSMIMVTYRLIARDDIEDCYSGKLVENKAYIIPDNPNDPDPKPYTETIPVFLSWLL